MNDNAKYRGNIVDELSYEPPMTDEFRAVYENFARRVLWIDGRLVPGAFQINASWYKSTPQQDPIFPEHSHPSAEIIAFFGADPEKPYELPADIDIVIGGEKHHVNGSSFIFIPPDVPHCLCIHEIRSPVFHFSVVTDATYNDSAYR